MATGNTSRDRMPNTWDGRSPWKGKKKPVALVNIVVAKKSLVQPSSYSPVSIPNTTMNPEKIPIKLNTTCTNVSGVMPKIMMRLLSREFCCHGPSRDGSLYRKHAEPDNAMPALRHGAAFFEIGHKCISMIHLFLFNGRCKEERAHDSKYSRDNKRGLWTNSPEQASNGRRRCDRQAPNQVVKPDRPRTQIVLRQVNNHGLARGLANLAQASDDESAHQPFEIRSQNDRHREKSKAQKSGDHKWLASQTICHLGRGEIYEDCSCKLHGDEDSIPRNCHARNVRYIEDDKNISHPFAGANRNVGNEQPLEHGVKRIPNTSQLHRVPRSEGHVDGPEDRDGDGHKDDRDQEPCSNAGLKSQCADHGAAEKRRNHHGDALQHGLDRESHRTPLPGESIADGCENRRRSHGLPSHRKSQPEKKKRPGGTEQVDEITRQRGNQERQKCAAAPPMIGQP